MLKSHFIEYSVIPEDFIEYSVDQQLRRERKRVDQTLTRKRLKPGAAPSVFENFPDYYRCKDVTSRSDLALASSLRDKETSLLNQQNEEFLQADRLTSFDDLIGALSNELQSETFITHKTNNGINLINLIEEQPPKILATISIEKSLKVKLYRKQQVLPLPSNSHIVSFGTVSLLSQVINLMAFAKNFHHPTLTSEDEFKENLTKLVESYIIGKSQNSQEIRLLIFFWNKSTYCSKANITDDILQNCCF